MAIFYQMQKWKELSDGQAPEVSLSVDKMFLSSKLNEWQPAQFVDTCVFQQHSACAHSCHVPTTMGVLLFSDEFHFFVYWLSHIFSVYVWTFMVWFYVVIDIFGLKVTVPCNLLCGCVFVGHGDKATHSAALVAISRNHEFGTKLVLHLQSLVFSMEQSLWH